MVIARRVDSVVARDKVCRAAEHIYNRAFYTLVRGRNINREIIISAVFLAERQRVVRVNAVVGGRKSEFAARNRNVPIRMNTVVRAVNVKFSAAYVKLRVRLNSLAAVALLGQRCVGMSAASH